MYSIEKNGDQSYEVQEVVASASRQLPLIDEARLRKTDVSGTGSGCGLFALSLGVKQVLGLPGIKPNPKLVEILQDVSEATVGPGASRAGRIGRRLRALLAEAMRRNKKYKEACLDIIKSYYFLEVRQKLDPALKKTAELFFNSEESNQYLCALSKSISDLHFSSDYQVMNEPDIQEEENKFFYEKIEEILTAQNFEPERVIALLEEYPCDTPEDLHKIVCLFESNRQKFPDKQTSTEKRKGLKNIAMEWFSHRINDFIRNNLDKDRLPDILLKLAESVYFIENNKKSEHVDSLLELAKRVYTEFQVGRDWEEIYEYHVKCARTEGVFLSAAELNPLAQEWGVNLFVCDKGQLSSSGSGDLIENGIDVTLCNPSGKHWMVVSDDSMQLQVQERKKSATQTLSLEEKSLFSNTEEALNQALWQAIEENNKEECDRLLKSGADINALAPVIGQMKESKKTILMRAILAKKDIDMIEFLLTHGAHTNAVDENKWSALHHFISVHSQLSKQKASRLLSLLLEYGADSSLKNDKDQTPFQMKEFDLQEMPLSIASYGFFTGINHFKCFETHSFFTEENLNNIDKFWFLSLINLLKELDSEISVEKIIIHAGGGYLFCLDALPDLLNDYKNHFIFIPCKNELYYIRSHKEEIKLEKILIKDIALFRSGISALSSKKESTLALTFHDVDSLISSNTDAPFEREGIYKNTALLFSLKLIYARLSGELDQALGVLTLDERIAILEKIKDGANYLGEAEQCSAMFAVRLNEVTNGFFYIKNLTQLLQCARNNIITHFANEGHGKNRIYTLASMGFGVTPMNVSDPSLGMMNDEIIISKLLFQFKNAYHPVRLIDILINEIKNQLYRMGYVGKKEIHKEEGYEYGQYTRMENYLELFLGTQNFSSLFQTEGEMSQVIDLNWMFIRKQLEIKLLEENYFTRGYKKIPVYKLDNARFLLESIRGQDAVDFFYYTALEEGVFESLLTSYIEKNISKDRDFLHQLGARAIVFDNETLFRRVLQKIKNLNLLCVFYPDTQVEAYKKKVQDIHIEIKRGGLSGVARPVKAANPPIQSAKISLPTIQVSQTKTLLMLSVTQSHGYKFVKILLENGADVNRRSDNGWRVIHHLSWSSHSNSMKMLSLLLDHQVDIHARISEGYCASELTALPTLREELLKLELLIEKKDEPTEPLEVDEPVETEIIKQLEPTYKKMDEPTVGVEVCHKVSFSVKNIQRIFDDAKWRLAKPIKALKRELRKLKKQLHSNQHAETAKQLIENGELLKKKRQALERSIQQHKVNIEAEEKASQKAIVEFKSGNTLTQLTNEIKEAPQSNSRADHLVQAVLVDDKIDRIEAKKIRLQLEDEKNKLESEQLKLEEEVKFCNLETEKLESEIAALEKEKLDLEDTLEKKKKNKLDALKLAENSLLDQISLLEEQRKTLGVQIETYSNLHYECIFDSHQLFCGATNLVVFAAMERLLKVKQDTFSNFNQRLQLLKNELKTLRRDHQNELDQLAETTTKEKNTIREHGQKIDASKQHMATHKLNKERAIKRIKDIKEELITKDERICEYLIKEEPLKTQEKGQLEPIIPVSVPEQTKNKSIAPTKDSLQETLAKEETELVKVNQEIADTENLLKQVQANQANDLQFLNEQIKEVETEKQLIEIATEFYQDAVLSVKDFTLAGYVAQKDSQPKPLIYQLLATLLQRQMHGAFIKASFEEEYTNDHFDYTDQIDEILQKGHINVNETITRKTLTALVQAVNQIHPEAVPSLSLTLEDGRIIYSEGAHHAPYTRHLYQHKQSILSIIPMKRALRADDTSVLHSREDIKREHIDILSRLEILKGLWRDLIHQHTGEALEKIEPAKLTQYVKEMTEKLQRITHFSEIKTALNLQDNGGLFIILTAHHLDKLGDKIDENNVLKIQLLSALFCLKHYELQRRIKQRAYQVEQNDPILSIQLKHFKAKTALQKLLEDQSKQAKTVSDAKVRQTQLNTEQEELEKCYQEQKKQIELDLDVIKKQQEALLDRVAEIKERHTAVQKQLRENLNQEAATRGKLIAEDNRLKESLSTCNEELKKLHDEVKRVTIEQKEAQSLFEGNENEYVENEAIRVKAEADLKAVIAMQEFIKTLNEQIKVKREINDDYAVTQSLRRTLKALRTSSQLSFEMILTELGKIPQLNAILPKIELLPEYDHYCFDILSVIEKIIEPPTELYNAEKHILTLSGYNIHWEDCKKIIRDKINSQLKKIGLKINERDRLECDRPELLPALNQLPYARLQGRIHDFIKTHYLRDSRLIDGWKEKSVAHQEAANVIRDLNIHYDEVLSCFYHSIELIAGHDVVIKENIKLNGVNFHVNAIDHVVFNEHAQIDVSGKAAREFTHTKARSGSDYDSMANSRPNSTAGDCGENALPGQSSGNIFIKAQLIENLNTLIRVISGGKGTRGQDGGDGGEGREGVGSPDAACTEIFKCASSSLTIARTTGVLKGGAIHPDERSEPGGKNGWGGWGSSNGCPGMQTIIDSTQTIGPEEGPVDQTPPKHGNNGKVGSPGKAGIDGKDFLRIRRGLGTGVEDYKEKFKADFDVSMLRDHENVWLSILSVLTFVGAVLDICLLRADPNIIQDDESDDYRRRVLVKWKWIDPEAMKQATNSMNQEQSCEEKRSQDPRSLGKAQTDIGTNPTEPNVPVPVRNETSDPTYQQHLQRLALESSVQTTWLTVHESLEKERTDLSARAEKYANKATENSRVRNSLQEKINKLQEELANATLQTDKKVEEEKTLQTQRADSSKEVDASYQRSLGLLTKLSDISAEAYTAALDATKASQALDAQAALQTKFDEAYQAQQQALAGKTAANKAILAKADQQEEIAEKIREKTAEVAVLEEKMQKRQEAQVQAVQEDEIALQALNKQSRRQHAKIMTQLKQKKPVEGMTSQGSVPVPLVSEGPRVRFDEAAEAIRTGKVPSEPKELEKFVDQYLHVLLNTATFGEEQVDEVWCVIEEFAKRMVPIEKINALIKVAQKKCQDYFSQDNLAIQKAIERILAGDGKLTPENKMQHIAKKKAFFVELKCNLANKLDDRQFILENYPTHIEQLDENVDYVAIAKKIDLKLNENDTASVQFAKIANAMTQHILQFFRGEESNPTEYLGYYEALIAHLKTNVLPIYPAFKNLYEAAKNHYLYLYLSEANLSNITKSLLDTAKNLYELFDDEEAQEILEKLIKSSQKNATAWILFLKEMQKSDKKDEPHFSRLFKAIKAAIDLSSIQKIEDGNTPISAQISDFVLINNETTPDDPLNAEDTILTVFKNKLKQITNGCINKIGLSPDTKLKKALKNIQITAGLLESLFTIQAHDQNEMTLEIFQRIVNDFLKAVAKVDESLALINQFRNRQFSLFQQTLYGKLNLDLTKMTNQNFYVTVIHAIKQLTDKTQIADYFKLIIHCYEIEVYINPKQFSENYLRLIEEEILQGPGMLNSESWYPFVLELNGKLKQSCTRLINTKHRKLVHDLKKQEADKIDNKILEYFYKFYHISDLSVDHDEVENRKLFIEVLLKRLAPIDREQYNTELDQSNKNPEQSLIDFLNKVAVKNIRFTVPDQDLDENLKSHFQKLNRYLEQEDIYPAYTQWESIISDVLPPLLETLSHSKESLILPQWMHQFIEESDRFFCEIIFHSPTTQCVIQSMQSSLVPFMMLLNEREIENNLDSLLQAMSQACYQSNHYQRVRRLAANQDARTSKRQQLDALDQIQKKFNSLWEPTVDLIQGLQNPCVKYTDLTASILTELDAERFSTDLKGRVKAVTDIIENAKSQVLTNALNTMLEHFLTAALDESRAEEAKIEARGFLLNVLNKKLTIEDFQGLFKLLRDSKYKRENLEKTCRVFFDEIHEVLALSCEEQIHTQLNSDQGKLSQDKEKIIAAMAACKRCFCLEDQFVVLFRIMEELSDSEKGLHLIEKDVLLNKLLQDFSVTLEQSVTLDAYCEKLININIAPSSAKQKAMREVYIIICLFNLATTQTSKNSITKLLEKINEIQSFYQDDEHYSLFPAFFLMRAYCLNVVISEDEQGVMERIIAHFNLLIWDKNAEAIFNNITALKNIMDSFVSKKELTVTDTLIQQLFKALPNQIQALLSTEEAAYAQSIQNKITVQTVMTKLPPHRWLEALKTAYLSELCTDLFSTVYEKSKWDALKKQFIDEKRGGIFEQFECALLTVITTDDYTLLESDYHKICAALSLSSNPESEQMQQLIEEIVEAKKIILISADLAEKNKQSLKWCQWIKNLIVIHHKKKLSPIAVQHLFHCARYKSSLEDITALTEQYDPDKNNENDLIHQILLVWIKSAVMTHLYESKGVKPEIILEKLKADHLNNKEAYTFIKMLGEILYSMPDEEPKALGTGTLLTIVEELIQNEIYKDKVLVAKLSKTSLSLWPVYLTRSKLAQQLSLDSSKKEHVKMIDSAVRLLKIVKPELLNQLIALLQQHRDDLTKATLLEGFSYKRWELNNETIALMKATPDQTTWAQVLTEKAEEDDAKLTDEERVKEFVKSMRDNIGPHMNKCLADLFQLEPNSNLTFLEQLIYDIQAKYKTDYELYINNSLKNPPEENELDIDKRVQERIEGLRKGDPKFCHDAHQNRDEFVNYFSLLMAAIKLENKKYTLRSTQLIALICFLQRGSEHIDGKFKGGRLAEISTGEGKTDTTRALAITLALRGENVDVLTSSEYLAERDGLEAKGLVERFGLTVGCNCDKTRMENETERQKCYAANRIVYGTVSAFQQDLLLTQFYEKNIRTKQAQNLIADEVDSLFIDQLGTTLYISHTITDLKEVRGIFVRIWEHVNSQEFFHNSIAHRNAVAERIKKEFSHHFEKKDKKVNLDLFIQNQLVTWIESAYCAKDDMHADVEYSIEDQGEYQGKPLINDLNRGVELVNSKWGNGLHQFIELKHTCALSDESLRAIFMSNMAFFKKYGSKIYGMTGTIGTEREQSLLHSIYDRLEFFKVPRYYKRSLVTEEGILVNSIPKWLRAIRKEVIQKVVKKVGEQRVPNRPVLILAENKRSAKQIYDDLKAKKAQFPDSKIFLFKGNLESITKKLEYTNLEPGTIIVATNIAGRGADFKTSEEIENNLGLHVITSYIPESKRVEEQGVGRTARGNVSSCNKGSSKFIVYHPLADQEGIHLTIEMLLAERDQLEQEKLDHIERHLLRVIKLERDLFQQYEEFTEIVKGKLRDAKTIYPEQQHQALINHWAYWLVSQEKNIHDVYEKGEQPVLDAFEAFKCEIMSSLRAGKELITDPCELMALGKYYRDQGKYADAKSCYEEVINTSTDLKGFAKYYLAFCSVDPNSDKKEKVTAIALLKEARSELMSLIHRLSGYNASVVTIGKQSQALGITLAPDRFTQRIKNEISLIGVHIHAIDVAIGSGLNESSFKTDLLSKEASDKLYHNVMMYLKDSKIDGHALVKGTRVSKKVTVDNEALFLNGSKVEFPMVFSDAKRKVLGFIQTRSGKIPLEDRLLAPQDLKEFIFTDEKFFNAVKELLFVSINILSIDKKAINLLGQNFWKSYQPFEEDIRAILTDPEYFILSENEFKRILHARIGEENINVEELTRTLLEKKVIKFNGCGMIRMLEDPRKLEIDELKNRLKKQAAYVLYNGTVFYVENDFKIKELMTTKPDELAALFPDDDQLHTLFEFEKITNLTGHVPGCAGFELKEECIRVLQSYFEDEDKKQNKAVDFFDALNLPNTIDRESTNRVKKVLETLHVMKHFTRDDIKSCFQGDSEDNVNLLWNQLMLLNIVKDPRPGCSLTNEAGQSHAAHPDAFFDKMKKEIENKIDKLVLDAPVTSHRLYFDPKLRRTTTNHGRDGYSVSPGNYKDYCRSYLLRGDKLEYMPDRLTEEETIEVPLLDKAKILALREQHPGKKFIELSPNEIESLITHNGGHVPEVESEVYKKCVFDALQAGIGTIKRFKYLELNKKQLQDCLEKGKIPPEIEDFIAMCCADVLSIAEWKSFWDPNILALFIVGAVELVFGAFLDAIGLGLLGQFFVGEGLGDMFYAIEAAINRNFNWDQWALHKAESMAMSIFTMGMGKLFQSTKEIVEVGEGIWKAMPSRLTHLIYQHAAPMLTNLVVSPISKMIVGSIFSGFRENFKQHLLKNDSYVTIKKEIKAIFLAMVDRFGDDAAIKVARALAASNLQQKIASTCTPQLLKITGVITSAILKNNKTGALAAGAQLVSNIIKWGGSAAIDLAHLATSSLQLFSAFKEQLNLQLRATANPVKSKMTESEKTQWMENEFEKMSEVFLDQIEACATSMLESNAGSQLYQHVVVPYINPLLKPLSNGMRNIKNQNKYQQALRGERPAGEMAELRDKLIRCGSNRVSSDADFTSETQVIGADNQPTTLAKIKAAYKNTDFHLFEHDNKLYVMKPKLEKFLKKFGNALMDLTLSATANQETMIILDSELNPHPDYSEPIKPAGGKASKKTVYYVLDNDHLSPCEVNAEGKPEPLSLPTLPNDADNNASTVQALLYQQLRDQGVSLDEAITFAGNVEAVNAFAENLKQTILNNPAAHKLYESGYAEQAPKIQAEHISRVKLTGHGQIYQVGLITDQLSAFKEVMKNRISDLLGEDHLIALKPKKETKKSTIEVGEEAIKVPVTETTENNPTVDEEFSVSSLTPTLEKLIKQQKSYCTDAFDEPTEEDLNKQSLVRGVSLETADVMDEHALRISGEATEKKVCERDEELQIKGFSKLPPGAATLGMPMSLNITGTSIVQGAVDIYKLFVSKAREMGSVMPDLKSKINLLIHPFSAEDLLRMSDSYPVPNSNDIVDSIVSGTQYLKSKINLLIHPFSTEVLLRMSDSYSVPNSNDIVDSIVKANEAYLNSLEQANENVTNSLGRMGVDLLETVSGIPSNPEEKVFYPFFETGEGLGLLIAEHMGLLSSDSPQYRQNQLVDVVNHFPERVKSVYDEFNEAPLYLKVEDIFSIGDKFFDPSKGFNLPHAFHKVNHFLERVEKVGHAVHKLSGEQHHPTYFSLGGMVTFLNSSHALAGKMSQAVDGSSVLKSTAGYLAVGSAVGMGLEVSMSPTPLKTSARLLVEFGSGLAGGTAATTLLTPLCATTFVLAPKCMEGAFLLGSIPGAKLGELGFDLTDYIVEQASQQAKASSAEELFRMTDSYPVPKSDIVDSIVSVTQYLKSKITHSLLPNCKLIVDSIVKAIEHDDMLDTKIDALGYHGSREDQMLLGRVIFNGIRNIPSALNPVNFAREASNALVVSLGAMGKIDRHDYVMRQYEKQTREELVVPFRQFMAASPIDKVEMALTASTTAISTGTATTLTQQMLRNIYLYGSITNPLLFRHPKPYSPPPNTVTLPADVALTKPGIYSYEIMDGKLSMAPASANGKKNLYQILDGKPFQETGTANVLPGAKVVASDCAGDFMTYRQSETLIKKAFERAGAKEVTLELSKIPEQTAENLAMLKDPVMAKYADPIITPPVGTKVPFDLIPDGRAMIFGLGEGYKQKETISPDEVGRKYSRDRFFSRPSPMGTSSNRASISVEEVSLEEDEKSLCSQQSN